MNDRLPGTTWDNPIWYRNYRIYIDDCAGTQRDGFGFAHDNYDPTPQYADDPPSDGRCGWARTLDEAKAEIDELECDTVQCEQCEIVRKGDAYFCRMCGFSADPPRPYSPGLHVQKVGRILRDGTVLECGTPEFNADLKARQAARQCGHGIVGDCPDCNANRFV